MGERMKEKLESYLAEAFPAWHGVHVRELQNINAGWESDVYAFETLFEHGGEEQRRKLVLRIYPGGDGSVKSRREFTGMQRLYAAGYPVPEVLRLGVEKSPFGRPFMVMDFFEGQMMWEMMDNATNQDRSRLMERFCGLFVRLHALDPTPFYNIEPDGIGPFTFVDGWLERVRAAYDQFPMPGFLPVYEWLLERKNLVPCERPAPVHWDFHPGNVLVSQDGSVVVIDWTQVEVSDSRFDLGWTLILAESHASKAMRDAILGGYEMLSGKRIRELAYFEVFACLKRLFSVAISLEAGPEQIGMRPGAEATIRREVGAFRRLYDILLRLTDLRVPEVEKILAG
jgi:aminoglycoside phosphotransferase (APT) family kinase protein